MASRHTGTHSSSPNAKASTSSRGESSLVKKAEVTPPQRALSRSDAISRSTVSEGRPLLRSEDELNVRLAELRSLGMVECTKCDTLTLVTEPMSGGTGIYPRKIPCSNTKCERSVLVYEDDDKAARRRLKEAGAQEPTRQEQIAASLKSQNDAAKKCYCSVCRNEVDFEPPANSFGVEYPRTIKCNHCQAKIRITRAQDDGARIRIGNAIAGGQKRQGRSG